MSKGMSSSAIIAIILGIVALLIILVVFGQPLFEQVESLFASGGLLGAKP